MMPKFQYNGNLREGMRCPKCIYKKEKAPGKLKFLSGGAYGTIVIFGCTKCDFQQKGYDNISIELGMF
jgi:hypothetical protein